MNLVFVKVRNVCNKFYEIGHPKRELPVSPHNSPVALNKPSFLLPITGTRAHCKFKIDTTIGRKPARLLIIIIHGLLDIICMCTYALPLSIFYSTDLWPVWESNDQLIFDTAGNSME